MLQEAQEVLVRLRGRAKQTAETLPISLTDGLQNGRILRRISS
jgi:hypothetical protein